MAKEAESTVWTVLLGASALLVCCAGPLLAAAGGFSLVGLAAALQPSRSSLVAGAVVLFTVGLYANRWGRGACCEPGNPSRARAGSRRLAIVLWTLAGVAVVAALVSVAATAGR